MNRRQLGCRFAERGVDMSMRMYGWIVRMRWLIAVIVAGFGAGGSRLSAQIVLDRDIDLVKDVGLSNSSAKGADFDILVGPNKDVTMSECGQLLAAFSTLSGYYLGRPGADLKGVPLFEAPHSDGTMAFEFSPSYTHYFLEYGDWLRDPFPAGWGYKGVPKQSCSLVPRHGALEIEGRGIVRLGGIGGLDIIDKGFTGLTWRVFGKGLNARAREIVNDNLLNNRPT